jgi:hypothetical protein
MGQETRNKLTDYWSDHEITKEDEYAILTNIIHQEWSGVSVKKHNDIKGLKTQNLRDHMSEAELIFTTLAELSTSRQTKAVKTKTGHWLGRDQEIKNWSNESFHLTFFRCVPRCENF